jgi:hypothetical protein
MRHLKNRHSGAGEVEKLLPGVLENIEGQGARTGPKVMGSHLSILA